MYLLIVFIFASSVSCSVDSRENNLYSNSAEDEDNPGEAENTAKGVKSKGL